MLPYAIGQFLWMLRSAVQLIGAMGTGVLWVLQMIRLFIYVGFVWIFFIPHWFWYLTSPNVICHVSYRSSETTRRRNLLHMLEAEGVDFVELLRRERQRRHQRNQARSQRGGGSCGLHGNATADRDSADPLAEWEQSGVENFDSGQVAAAPTGAAAPPGSISDHPVLSPERRPQSRTPSLRLQLSSSCAENGDSRRRRRRQEVHIARRLADTASGVTTDTTGNAEETGAAGGAVGAGRGGRGRSRVPQPMRGSPTMTWGELHRLLGPAALSLNPADGSTLKCSLPLRHRRSQPPRKTRHGPPTRPSASLLLTSSPTEHALSGAPATDGVVPPEKDSSSVNSGVLRPECEATHGDHSATRAHTPATMTHASQGLTTTATTTACKTSSIATQSPRDGTMTPSAAPNKFACRIFHYSDGQDEEDENRSAEGAAVEAAAADQATSLVDNTRAANTTPTAATRAMRMESPFLRKAQPSASRGIDVRGPPSGGESAEAHAAPPPPTTAQPHLPRQANGSSITAPAPPPHAFTAGAARQCDASSPSVATTSSPFPLRDDEEDEEDKMNLHNRATLDIILPVPLDTLMKSLDYAKQNKRLRRKKFPVVILVSGGAWIIGSHLWSTMLARVLAARGYVVFCPDYRNFPQTTMEGMTLDVSDAIAWVLNNAERYNGDLDDVTLLGQSAGAHLTMMSLISQAQLAACEAAGGTTKDANAPAPSDVAYNVPRYNPRKSIKCYIGLSGIYNIEKLTGHFDRRGLYRGVLYQIAGNQPSMARYSIHAHFDPRRAGETGEVLPDNVFDFLPQRMCFLHGDADKSAPVTESASVVYTLRQAQDAFRERRRAKELLRRRQAQQCEAVMQAVRRTAVGAAGVVCGQTATTAAHLTGEAATLFSHTTSLTQHLQDGGTKNTQVRSPCAPAVVPLRATESSPPCVGPVDFEFVLIPGASHTDPIVEECVVAHRSCCADFMCDYESAADLRCSSPRAQLASPASPAKDKRRSFKAQFSLSSPTFWPARNQEVWRTAGWDISADAVLPMAVAPDKLPWGMRLFRLLSPF